MVRVDGIVAFCDRLFLAVVQWYGPIQRSGRLDAAVETALDKVSREGAEVAGFLRAVVLRVELRLPCGRVGVACVAQAPPLLRARRPACPN